MDVVRGSPSPLDVAAGAAPPEGATVGVATAAVATGAAVAVPLPLPALFPSHAKLALTATRISVAFLGARGCPVVGSTPVSFLKSLAGGGTRAKVICEPVNAITPTPGVLSFPRSMPQLSRNDFMNWKKLLD